MNSHLSLIAAGLIGASYAFYAASPALAQWQYGVHPVLGLSAHIDTDHGAVGLACHRSEFSPINDNFVAIRISESLLHDGSFVMLFEGGIDINTLRADEDRGPDAYGEWIGNTCLTGVDSFQRAQNLVTTPAHLVSFGGWAEEAYVDFELEGMSGRAFQADGYQALPKRRAISLQGSFAAISALIAACPSMRIDIADNCGI